MVVTPVRDAGVKHVEFVALGVDQTLAVMVFDDGAVENRLMRTPPGLTPSALQEASNFLNARLKGRTLSETKAEVGVELDVARSELNATAARLVEDGLAAWGGGRRRGPGADRARPRQPFAATPGRGSGAGALLFDDLEQKEQLIGLLDDVRDGGGRAHFHRRGNAAFSLSGSAVIAAPYMTGRQKVVGAIGVIGPARLNYARVIPWWTIPPRCSGKCSTAETPQEGRRWSTTLLTMRNTVWTPAVLKLKQRMQPRTKF